MNTSSTLDATPDNDATAAVDAAAAAVATASHNEEALKLQTNVRRALEIQLKFIEGLTPILPNLTPQTRSIMFLYLEVLHIHTQLSKQVQRLHALDMGTIRHRVTINQVHRTIKSITSVLAKYQDLRQQVKPEEQMDRLMLLAMSTTLDDLERIVALMQDVGLELAAYMEDNGEDEEADGATDEEDEEDDRATDDTTAENNGTTLGHEEEDGDEVATSALL